MMFKTRYTMADLGRDLELADKGDAFARACAEDALRNVGRNRDLTERLARRLRAVRAVESDRRKS